MPIDAIRAIQRGRIPTGRGWSKRATAVAEAVGRQTTVSAPYAPILLEEPPALSDYRAYLAWIRRCREHLAARRRFRLWWGGKICTATEFTERFRAAIDYHLNLRGGLLQPANGPHWRKLEEGYQHQLASDAQAVRRHYQERVALHWLGTPELRRRYAHLLER